MSDELVINYGDLIRVDVRHNKEVFVELSKEGVQGPAGPKGDKGDMGDITPELDTARDEAVTARDEAVAARDETVAKVDVATSRLISTDSKVNSARLPHTAA
jgi:hypothetical protein